MLIITKRMAKELFNRYIWLTNTIYKAGHISYSEINRKWKNSTLSNGDDFALRTFHNHRNAIEEIFNISIQCDGHTNKYYIENADEMEGNKLTKWLLNSFSIRNIILESGNIQDRIILEDIPSAQNFLEDIVLAMQRNRAIQVLYHPFTKDQPFVIDLEPYFLKLFNRRWYMFCHSADSDLIKVYALDRIENLIITERIFEMPLDFSPENHLFNSIGIIKNESICPVEIIVKAYGLHPKYLKALPMHHTQKELKSTSDFTFFSYQLSPTFDFYQEILSRKEYVEIVSPEEVREEFKTILSRIVDYYNGNESH